MEISIKVNSTVVNGMVEEKFYIRTEKWNKEFGYRILSNEIYYMNNIIFILY